MYTQHLRIHQNTIKGGQRNSTLVWEEKLLLQEAYYRHSTLGSWLVQVFSVRISKRHNLFHQTCYSKQNSQTQYSFGWWKNNVYNKHEFKGARARRFFQAWWQRNDKQWLVRALSWVRFGCRRDVRHPRIVSAIRVPLTGASQGVESFQA